MCFHSKCCFKSKKQCFIDLKAKRSLIWRQLIIVESLDYQSNRVYTKLITDFRGTLYYFVLKRKAKTVASSVVYLNFVSNVWHCLLFVLKMTIVKLGLETISCKEKTKLKQKTALENHLWQNVGLRKYKKKSVFKMKINNALGLLTVNLIF